MPPAHDSVRTPLARLCNYVGGEFVATSARFADINPVDGSVHAEACEAGPDLVDRAVEAGREALGGGWGRLPAEDRSRLLRRVAARMTERFDEFVAAEVADTGKPASLARTLDVPRGIANFEVFADLLRAAGGECFETSTADGRGALNYTLRKPLGVVAVICPWNLPLLLLSWKVAPAMAAGNAVVVKPSEETPASATLLAEVMHEVGVPPGAFNLLHGFGPGSTGELLTRHDGIDAITFTGESGTGRAIMRAAADSVKPLSFELGGKNAAIVFADADFAAAVEGVARSAFANCGQVCLCTERVYVERRIFDRFVAALAARARALLPGLPNDPGTSLGPLISANHREKVLSYYTLGRKEGASVVTGGGVPQFGDPRDGGSWIEPTVWTGLAETARCVKEEIFGPVCHVAPFDDEDEAIGLANDSRYGLAAALWTTDLSRAHRLAGRLAAGIVWVNTWFLRDLRTPFGGIRLSGIGREGGMHSLNFYSAPTTVCIKL